MARKKRVEEKKGGEKKFESLKEKTGPIKSEKINKIVQMQEKKRVEVIKEGRKKGVPLVYAALIVIVIAALGAALIFMNPTTVGKTVIKEGDVVQIAYIAKLQNGSVFDSGNFTFKVGANEAIDGVDSAVIGMKFDESKTVTLTPEQAYGYYDPYKVIDIPLTQVLNKTETLSPEEFNLTFGVQPMLNQAYQLEGMNWPMRIISIENGTVTLKHEPDNGMEFDLKDTLGKIYGTAKVTVTDDQILVRASPIDGSEVATVIGLGRIIGMNETSMQMDFNNKLAGQTLTFEITVLNFIPY